MAARDVNPDGPRRAALKAAVCALCTEVGFGHAQHSAIETLTEMLQSYINELGRSAQAYAELSCRTVPMCSDVAMALIDMGMDVRKLPEYAQRREKVSLPSQMTMSAPNPPRILQIGDTKQHPSHIPEHLPVFPDPHTYIKSMTQKKPLTEYQTLREKAACQKRDVERALTRLIAKTGDTEKLFEDDPYAFPLIACKPSELPYLDALLPKDEDFEGQEADESQQPNQQKAEAEQKPDEGDKIATGDKNKDGEVVKKEGEDKSPSKEESSNQNETEGDSSAIDNPYLRPIKMPRLKGGKSAKSKW